jgi:hypothetical protein
MISNSGHYASAAGGGEGIPAPSLRIPTMPISRSSGSRSVIPIDPDQRGVSAPLDHS